MKFIKFVIVYLLLFTSYIAYRFSQLEPDHLHAVTLALGAVGALLSSVVTISTLGKEVDVESESVDGE